MPALRAALVTLLLTTPALAGFVDKQVVGAAGRSAMQPLVAANAGAFVAVWQEESKVVIGRVEADGSFTRTGSISAFVPFVRAILPIADGFLLLVTTNGSLQASQIDLAGKVVAAPRIVLQGWAAYAASNGDRVLVVNEYGEAVIVSPAATIIRDRIRVAANGVITAYAAVAANGSGFLVAWPQSKEIGITSLTFDGVPVKTTVLAEDDYPSSLTLASDGDAFLLAYRSSGDVRGFRTTADGTPMEPARRLAIGPGGSGEVHVAWSGKEYVAVYDTPSAIRRLFIARGGAVTAADALVQHDDAWHRSPRIATVGNDFAVVWNEWAPCGPAHAQVWAIRASSPPRLASVGFADNSTPAVALGSGMPFVVWDEIRERAMLRSDETAIHNSSIYAVAAGDRGSIVASFVFDESCGYTVHATLFDANGRVVASEQISSDAVPRRGTWSPHPITTAWNGSEYLVAWTIAGAIVGVRVTPDGSVLDPVPVPLVTNSEPGDIGGRLTWDGRWTLVWARSYLPYIPLYPGPPSTNVVSIRSFDAQLSPLGASTIIANRGWSPAASGSVVAWRDSLNVYVRDLNSGRMVTFPSTRGYGSSLDVAVANGQIYILDFDDLVVVSGSSVKRVFKLANVTSTSMATDGQRLALAWSTPQEDGLARVASTALDFARRRTATKYP
jgi:hypothetical protein